MAVTLPASHRFFPQPIARTLEAAKQDKKAKLVNVGGDGDREFRAVATGLIDNFLTNQRETANVLSKIFIRHMTYYPQHRTGAANIMTPAVRERMLQFINHTSMPELLETMAYTLRQMTVDELLANPAQYRDVFVKKNESTSPAMMRQPSTPIDKSAIAALAKAIESSIDLKVVAQGKELHVRLNNNTASTHPKVTIQLQAAQYISLVTHIDRFKIVQSHPSRHVDPVVHATNDLSLKQIHTIIAEDDKVLLEKFESTKRLLEFMVNEAKELTKADLFNMYVRGMGNSDNLQGRRSYAGTEHGHQQFFATIYQAQHGTEIVQLPAKTHEEQVISELIHGIASAISIGQMSKNIIDAALDHKKEASTVHAPRGLTI